jgi:copper chaperone CopZ
MAIELKVTGMTCDGCKNAVERVVRRIQGVTAATVQLAEGRLVVEGAAARDEVVKAIERAGYGVA